jgi:hypothetical protein
MAAWTEFDRPGRRSGPRLAREIAAPRVFAAVIQKILRFPSQPPAAFDMPNFPKPNAMAIKT